MQYLPFVALAASLAASTQAFSSPADSASPSDSAFSNDLSSKLLVSPAQTYQVDGGATSALLSTERGSTKGKANGISGLDFSSTTAVVDSRTVTAVAAVPGLRLGLGLHYGSDFMATDHVFVGLGRYADRLDRWTLSPELSYSLGLVVLGFAYDYNRGVESTSKFGAQSAVQRTGQWSTYRPAVLIKTSAMEAGLAYSSATYKSPDNAASKELNIAEPASVTAHGRLAVSELFSVGAICVDKMYSSHSGETLYDQVTTLATVEFKSGGFKLDSYGGVAAHYYRSKDRLNNDTMTKEVYGADANFALSPMAHLGFGLGMTSGSDSGANSSYTQNSAALRLMGGLSF